ncbi:MAG: Ig-like domain-containing protein, partial [Eubacterium callanderi]|uniref:Ig-like domain-containing protein n=2 Tax=Eubacteriaceae TaxID=186806 RepID=UPI0039917636
MENYKSSLAKRCLSVLLMVAMVLSTFVPFTKPTYAAAQDSSAITAENMAANQYETYYYTSDRQYTYNGDVVTFVSETQIEAGGQTYDLKNKQTDIDVSVDGDTATVSFTNVTIPISQVSGAWNSSYAGEAKIQYNSDIPGQAKVESANMKMDQLVISGLSEGTYHLTGGTIFEKANEWSPGIDLDGDGNKETEGYFGTMPDITLVVGDSTEEPGGAEKPSDDAIVITTEDLSVNKYETYYYTDQAEYAYNGKKVEFISESQFKAGSETVDLKNKKTDINVSVADGIATVAFTNLSTPINSISGEWNSGSGGTVQIQYDSDIPGKAKITSSNKDLSKLVIEGLSEGTYHLTGGTIFEKANQWSPGTDLNGDGKKETEGYFGTLPDITIVVGSSEQPVEPDVYLGDKTEAKIYDDFENDVWLQYQQKDMKVGETANLRPWRVPQIITNAITNDVARPQFNFEIISGDSVSLSTAKTDEKAVVTAVKPGTSVVKVTYDALDYKNQHWDPISTVNTGYAVYTVGEEGTAIITCNDELTNWRHYDTIYYNEGDTVPYDFTVDTTGAESVKVTCNGIEIKGNGNQYTANLENRSNIIGVVATDADGKTKSFYRVIDARFIEVNVKNKTNDGQPIKAGDTANISFRGITMPVYKLATIYNPQMGSNSTYVSYKSEQLGQSFKGQCSQWDLATNNDFDVTFDKDGDYTFTSDEGIYCAWWGSELGADITAEGSGEPNLNAPTLKDYFSMLPDFTINVGSGVAVESITLNKTELELEEGQSEQLTAAVLPENATTKTVTWTSSQPEVATVDSKGEVTAVKSGQAVIKAAIGDKEATCTVTVTENENPAVIPVESVSVLPKVMGMMAGMSSRLRVTVLPENATDKTVTWTSSDPNVVLVNAEGAVTFVSAGKATITASAGGKEDTCEVTVSANPYLTKYELSPEKIQPGTKVTLSLPELEVPATDADPVHTMQTRYNTTIPGLSQVTSAEAKDQEDLIRTVTFTIPDNTEPGTYYLTDGCVYKEWGGTLVQGVFWTNKQSQEFYKNMRMPVVAVVVEDSYQAEKEAAQAVTDQINALGEITLDKENDVKAARDAYDGLSKKAKSYVSDETVKTLVEAEMTIKDLKPVIGQVTISVERFTLGQGYYIEPVNVALKEDNSCSDIIRRLIGNDNFLGQANYLSGIKGADLGADKVAIPEYISKYYGGPTTEEALAIGNPDEYLGEFDYNQGSGWYYFVNNKAPNVGINDRMPNDGDVIRLQFTLVYGSDLKSNESFTIADKDNLTKALANLNGREDKEELLANTAVKTAYDKALEAAQDMGLSQNDTDAAAAALNDAITAVDDLKELGSYKETSKAGLDTYKNSADYRDAQKTELAKAIEDGKKAIDAASDKAGVDKAVADAKAAMDAIKTDAQLTEEE